MTEFKTLDQVNIVLEKLIPSAFIASKDYKLDRMKALLAACGNPDKQLKKVIHVAGTSGKTSTSYYIATALKEVGHTVGLTVSPHVDTVRERVQLNGEPLSEELFCKYFSEFYPCLKNLKEAPSYFECLIAFAIWLFARENVEYAVIEVGMGGRKDPTNAMKVKDKVCVITDIGLDHTEVLGDRLDQIAQEKAGIIQTNNHIFMYEQEAQIMTIIDNVVSENKANLHIVRQASNDHIPTHLPLFQRRNWLLALAVVHTILGKRLTPEQQEAFSRVVIPARMEIVEKQGRIIVMDGSHNGQKMQALAVSLASRFPDQKFAVLAGFVEADNPRAYEAIDQLFPLIERIIFTGFSGKQDTPKRGINPDILSDYVKTKGFISPEVIKDPAAAYQALLAGKNDLMLVTGSFYLLNHIRPLVLEA